MAQTQAWHQEARLRGGADAEEVERLKTIEAAARYLVNSSASAKEARGERWDPEEDPIIMHHAFTALVAALRSRT